MKPNAIINRIAIVCSWLAIFVATFMFTSPMVSAAPAKCYTVAGQGSIIREVPCDGTFQSLSQVVLGQPLQDDSCYAAAVEAVGAIERGALGSELCNNYAAGTGMVAASPSKCYLIEQNIDYSTIYDSNFNPGALSEVQCTEQLRSILPSGSQTFASGVCYVFGTDGTSVTYPCARIASVQNTARVEAQAPPDLTPEEREELVKCDGSDAAGLEECLDKNPIIDWIRIIINFLTAGAGVIITIMVIVGGIQYASAGPNPQKVVEARGKITSAIVALLALAFLYAFLQWLVPGGVF